MDKFITWLFLALCFTTSVKSQMVDGGYSEWSQWEAPVCALTCGGTVPGTSTRHRICNNGGRDCVGSPTETRAGFCTVQNCAGCAADGDCNNGGTCDTTGTNNVCACATGWYGDTCDDSCQADTDCGTGGSCDTSGTSNSCTGRTGDQCENAGVLARPLVILLLLPIVTSLL